jgi:hypothetical protein
LAQRGYKRNGVVTLRLEPAEMRALHGFLALGCHFAAVVSGESSQFSPDEVRIYTAAISIDAASTLIAKISVAEVTIHNQSGDEPEMKTLEDLLPRPECGQHYREVAGRLRLIAQQIRYPNARREVLDLATKYEWRGDHFDTRNGAGIPDLPDPG